MRGDDKTFMGLLFQNTVFKWTSMILLAGNVILGLALLFESRKSVQIVAVSSDGQAAWTANANEAVFRNMAIHDSKDFIECVSTVDAFRVPTARRKAEWYLTPGLAKEVKKTVSDSNLIMSLTLRGARSDIEWSIPPRIVEWHFPSCRIYGAYTVVEQERDGKINREAHHMIVSAVFLGSSESRPSGFYVAGFRYLTDDKSINDILNKIGG